MAENTTTVTLKSPLLTHSGAVTTITLKEPKAKSFFDHGECFKAKSIMEGENYRLEFDYNNKVFALFLQDMCGIDTMILSNIAASDYFSLRTAATNLIIGIAGTDPTVA